MRPRVIDSFDAEKAIDTYGWGAPFAKTSVEMKAALDQFKDLTARLPESRKGDDEAWIVANRDSILERLETGGALWFRGMELMKTKESVAPSSTAG